MTRPLLTLLSCLAIAVPPFSLCAWVAGSGTQYAALYTAFAAMFWANGVACVWAWKEWRKA